LTTDPADDICPAFSPDGRSIGFVRVSKERATFMVIPAIGGPERVVADVTFPDFWAYAFFSWFPDGKWIVTRGLELISTETGETRRLTSPPTKSLPDSWPAVSPDGRTVAFGRSAGFIRSIYLLDLTEDLKPKGELRRLTSLKEHLWGLAWTPDGQEIIFSSGFIANMSLWKVSASGAGEPEPLPFTGEGIYPTISRIGNRLAYQNAVCDTSIWRLSLSDPGMAAGAPSPFIVSTRAEQSAHYSPDGKRIAFESDRSGRRGIWVSDADGSNTVELFSRSGRACGIPHWSPDGQRIAFISDLEGNFDIYIIRASGGEPVRLTFDSLADYSPSWSRDGNCIYFASNRTGRGEVWKVPTGGGKEI
jgi:Tol biopolymer transport system component